MILRITGSLPLPLADFAAEWVQQQGLDSVQVICSGGFRLEERIRERNPRVSIRGNDVSLPTCVTGRFLTHGAEDSISFLSPYEVLNGCSSRLLAAVALSSALSSRMVRIAPDKHDPSGIVSLAEKKIAMAKEGRDWLRLDRYSEKDLSQVALDCDADAIIGAPPTYKGGYESMYRQLPRFVSWEPPSYGRWDPAAFPDFCGEVDARGKPWLLFSDQYHPGLPLLTFYERLNFRSIYAYGAPRVRTVVQWPSIPKAEGYAVCDSGVITPKSQCRVHPLTAAEFAALGNMHTTLSPSSLANVQNGMGVFIDGAFAGSFGFALANRSHSDFDVLCDFAVSGKRRLSKLIPMLIRAREVSEYLEATNWIRTDGVATIVLTDAPYSMKYRGTGFEIRSRSQSTVPRRSRTSMVSSSCTSPSSGKIPNKRPNRKETPGAGDLGGRPFLNVAGLAR